MVWLIVPAVFLVLGAGALVVSASEQQAENRRREEKSRQAAQQGRRTPIEGEARKRQKTEAERFRQKRNLETSQHASSLSRGHREVGVKRLLETESRLTNELKERSEKIRELEHKMKEINTLKGVIERGRCS